MVKRLHTLFIILFLSISFAAHSTHIVGGSLTYVYNGGSSYTITLKLYRDCSPSSAAFPASVTINVAGYNGATFVPSKDITMAIGTVTAVPSNLDPCAVPPTPLPCVQQAIYTTTVNNLPPNPGGYHLYYQIVARNLTLLNVNAACNCVGESFYAYIPGQPVTWYEDFLLANGTTVDNGATAWSIAAGPIAPATARVNGNLFEITGANNASETWTSQTVNISGCTTANLRVDLSETGTLDPNDTIFVYYRVNGGPLIPFGVSGIIADDFTNATASAIGVFGTTVQIVIRVHYDANSPTSEVYRFDNVVVSCNSFQPNSNPVFNNFPPLFLCVNNPFVFDHSATDANGDSLYYSFYTPYDGDTGVGPLDPTYSSNTATFTPIVFLPGYGPTNPLGGVPLNLNPNTGLMTGTPTMLGQFVVGVVVKEYRNGNYISSTLRDFQFNVVNCPNPPVAVGGSNITINNGCVGHLTASGYNAATVTWHSIFPGASGAYNSYLSCTSGCMTPTVTPGVSPPAFVDYVVCGMSASCNPQSVCDTVRVTINPPLTVNIVPINPTICFGQTSTTITANGSGGTPGYSYLWNNVNPTQSISVGAGTYNVTVSDASGCPSGTATVTVTAFTTAITANAGADDTVCTQSPVATLHGAITGASGGVWSGGGGAYSPSSTTLNANYTPTAAEIAAGFVNLTLTTTGNGTCPAGSDVVKIYFMGFTGTPVVTPVNISCFGGTNGSATASMTGGISPFTYHWNTVPPQNTATASNLAPGTYTVTITSGIGCTSQTTATITQPAPLALSPSITNASCPAGSTGAITVTAVGGTAPYAYLWSPGGQTTATISGQAAGTYTITVTDAKGCVISAPYTITQPAPITIAIAQTNVSCFSANNGTAATTVTGGTPAYSYSWTGGAGTSSTASGLHAASYTVTVTDARGCSATNSVNITEPTALSATTTLTNVTCSGSSSGTATAVPVGGTTPYSYAWSPGGATTATASGLSAGTYTVTVTDSKGCSVNAFAVITEPMPLAVTMINLVNVSCTGGNNGSVKASPAGGTLPYTYSWAPGGATTQTISGMAAGTYTVTVTDANGCTVQNQATITEPSSAVTVTGVITNVSCSAGNNGAIVATPVGGTPPYTYLWTPGGLTASSISGRAAGTYTLKVTDSKGCQVINTFIITQPAVLAITITKTNVNCFNGSDGTATANVTGGTLPYSYSWSPIGGTGATATGLPIGSYTVTVIDANGCSKTGTVTLIQPSVVLSSITTVPETCDYLDNGSATVHNSGGSPGYTYSWSPGGATTATATGLASGTTYTVTVTDSKGCATTATANVTQPVPLGINFNPIVPVACFGGNNGAVSATPSGGTPNYIYLWSPGGAVTNSISGLAAGTYTLTIRDNHSCLTTSTVVITQPAAPVTVATSSTLTTCYGAATGSATGTASGGTGPYTYNWMPGNISGVTANGLAAGTYTVTATDSHGCTGTNTVAVSQPVQIVPTTSVVNANCGTPSGSASVSVTGGVGPYTYSWSPSGGNAATATGLLAGAYNVTVTDANGCTATQVANVNDNSGPSATIFSIVNVSCHGGSDGSASVGVAGGTGPFTYSWIPVGGSAPTATGLSAGTYTVTVVDVNGCQSNATTTPSITQPPAIVIGLTTTPVHCFGGTDGGATVSATGGTAPYSYQWLPGGSTGPSVTGLSANTYTVQVTDAHSCIQTLPFTVSQPVQALAVSVTPTNISCFGGSNGAISSLATGGTTPYNYNWVPGSISGQNLSGLGIGTYTVTVTDNNNCSTTNSVTLTQPTPLTLATSSQNANCTTASGKAFASSTGGTVPYTFVWTPGSIVNDTASNLFPGSYAVVVTDNNGCTLSDTVTVNDNTSPVAAIVSTTNISCHGGTDGTATVGVTGGTAPFGYAWLPSGGSAPMATGLSAGTYTITVTDAHGCTSSAITDPALTEPLALSLILTGTNVSCAGSNNGSADAAVFGGTPPYSYAWTPGGSTASTLDFLNAGSYTVLVTDSSSCTISGVVAITQPLVFNASIASSSNVSCFGGANGSATVNASGGTPFYSYSWAPYGGSNATATGLSAGTFTVSVTDLQGCSTTATIIITQPAQVLTATSTGSGTSCFAGSNGTATVTPAGGTPSYSYLWAPSGGTASTASGLSPGNYFVLVTDSHGCQAISTVAISQPTIVASTISITNPSCGLPNGVLTSMVSGGTAPYTYSWTPGGATTSTINNLGPGSYTLVVRDSANCASSISATLTNIPGPTVTISSVTNVSCFGMNDGSATASITSGTSPYTSVWQPYGGIGSTGTGFVAGTYLITVTDSLGCIATVSTTITQPTAVGVMASPITNVSCNGGSNGAITAVASGGIPGYNYSWSPVAASTPAISGIPAGSYTVSVTDQHNCLASISVNITEPAALTTSVATVVNPTCFNSTNGSATVSIGGGTVPYSCLWSDGQTGSTANNLAAGPYTLTTTDGNGCVTVSNVTLTQPTQVITSAGSADTICLGSTGSVTATATGGAGNYSYAWQPSGAVNSGTLAVSPGTTTTYTVIAYDQLGCAGTPDTVSTVVLNLTNANVDVTSPLTLICPGQSTSVLATATGVTGALTYSWNQGLGTGPGSFTVTPTTPTTTYVVTVTNSCGTSVRDSITVLYSPPPTLIIFSDSNIVCVPNTIQFYDSSQTGNPLDQIHSWSWNFGDGTSSQLSDPTHMYTTPGIYNVYLTVTTGNGCTSTNATSPLVIQANPFPVAAFSVNSTTLDLPYDPLVCSNQSVGASSYSWNFGDGSTSGATNPEHLYTTIGTYPVQLIATSTLGCPDTAYTTVTTNTDVTFPTAFTPNPDGPGGGGYDIGSLTNDVFFAYVSGVTDYKLQIFDRWGELIFETFDIKKGWDGYYKGKLCQQDVYIWKAYIKLNNGKVFNKAGDVTLIR